MSDEPSSGRDLTPDPLVEALVPDPAEGPPDATVLEGYLGRGTGEGRWRLYTTPALDEYVELAESDILYARKLPDDGGTRVWVPASLELVYVQAARRRTQAEFLGGPITAAGLGAPAAAMRAAAAPPPPSDFVPCPSDVGCPSDDFPCTSVPIIRCPRPSVPIIRCPRPTTPLAGCPIPTTPAAGCPPPTTPAAGCPIPTTPGAGCPRPTTPAAGCPLPSEDFFPCESFGGPRCPTRPIGCPTNVLRCRTNEPACRSEFGCPSGPICGGGLGF